MSTFHNLIEEFKKSIASAEKVSQIQNRDTCPSRKIITKILNMNQDMMKTLGKLPV